MKHFYNPYTFKLLKHLWAFCEKYKLFEGRDIVIAVSGGMDSMALLWCFHEFYKQGKLQNKVRAITINHQTRAEIDDEVLRIKKFCTYLGVEHTEKKVSGLSLEISNFENLARNARYESLLKDLKTNEVLLLAHHLDDCFEWSLMQSFKSSNLKTQLGIPLKRGLIRRPFFCLSKKQIQKLVMLESIDYIDDSSNLNLKFERNYVRHEIVSKIKKQFPAYLKHYVQNQLSLKKLLVTEALQKEKIAIHTRTWGFLIYLPDKNVKLDDQTLRECIVKLSNKSRGKIQAQMQIVLTKYNEHRSQNFGPFSLSGGVKIYQFGPFLCITNKSEIWLHASQITDLLPFLMKAKKNQGLKSLHPIFRASKEINFPVQYFSHFSTSEVSFFI